TFNVVPVTVPLAPAITPAPETVIVTLVPLRAEPMAICPPPAAERILSPAPMSEPLSTRSPPPMALTVAAPVVVTLVPLANDTAGLVAVLDPVNVRVPTVNDAPSISSPLLLTFNEARAPEPATPPMVNPAL